VQCDAAGNWKFLANGQIQVGENCLSQKGAGAGSQNVALNAAVQATSSARAASHGAAAAVDADGTTFWASASDEHDPVEFTLDFGEERSMSSIKIMWASAPQAFSVAAAADGNTWVQVYTTDVNMENVTRIPLKQTRARKLKVVMTKPLALYYGIKSITAMSPALQTTLDSCSAAAESQDARDKYFASYVSTSEPALAAALQAELPSLLAAKASLSSSLNGVAAAYGKVSACKVANAAAALLTTGFGSILSERSRTVRKHSIVAAEGGLMELVDDMAGIRTADVRLLLAAAKAAIVQLRAALR